MNLQVLVGMQWFIVAVMFVLLTVAMCSGSRMLSWGVKYCDVWPAFIH